MHDDDGRCVHVERDSKAVKFRNSDISPPMEIPVTITDLCSLHAILVVLDEGHTLSPEWSRQLDVLNAYGQFWLFGMSGSSVSIPTIPATRARSVPDHGGFGK